MPFPRASKALDRFTVLEQFPWPSITAAGKNVRNLQEIPADGGVLNYWVVSLKG